MGTEIWKKVSYMCKTCNLNPAQHKVGVTLYWIDLDPVAKVGTASHMWPCSERHTKFDIHI